MLIAVQSPSLERPIVLQFEITSHCNLACEMCPLTTGTSSSSGHRGHMSDETWRHLVSAARWVGRVALAGYGEPFTDPSTVDRLAELDGHGVALALATNGTRVSPTIAERLSRLEHLIEVNVSIDTPETASYRRLRHGSLTRALAGVRALSDALPHDRLVVSAILFPDSAATWDRFPSTLTELGVRRLSIAASHDYNDFSRSHRASPTVPP